MKKKVYIFFLGCLIILFWNCHSKVEITSEAFYHWKSNFQPTAAELDLLKEKEVDTLFVRYFDVVNKRGKPSPTSVLKYAKKPTQKVIPTIFIVQQVLEQLSEEEIKILADRIYQKVKGIHPFTQQKLDAIQLDCDWTSASQENFFLLCKHLKNKGLYIYSTIRLHQVKYFRKTGVPPVDKGIVMCYATEDIDANTENSILNINLLKDYLKNLSEYPLNVDFALPIYSWGVVTNHLGKKMLINALTLYQLKNNTHFKPKNENTFICLEETFVNGVFINKNFTIRVEEIDQKLLKDATQIIQNKAKNDFQLIYYHLDKDFIPIFDE